MIVQLVATIRIDAWDRRCRSADRFVSVRHRCSGICVWILTGSSTVCVENRWLLYGGRGAAGGGSSGDRGRGGMAGGVGVQRSSWDLFVRIEYALTDRTEERETSVSDRVRGRLMGARDLWVLRDAIDSLRSVGCSGAEENEDGADEEDEEDEDADDDEDNCNEDEEDGTGPVMTGVTGADCVHDVLSAE